MPEWDFTKENAEITIGFLESVINLVPDPMRKLYEKEIKTTFDFIYAARDKAPNNADRISKPCQGEKKT